MSWLKRILIAVAILLAVFVGVGLLLPDRAHVERSILIDRAPGDVYALIDGFTRFDEWSPWADYDPTARTELSGPARGVGATLRWSGDKGSGSQEIIALVPGRSVVVALDFGSSGRGTARFDLQAENSGTRLTWSFYTDFDGNLIGRWIGLAMDRLLGPDYERGLADLKRIAETEPSLPPAEPDPAPVANDPPDAAVPDSTEDADRRAQ